MSMVTVHGPNTMYTTQGTPAASSPAGALATVNPTNGLQWNFQWLQPAGRPATDFDWTFTGPGSPAAQNDRFSGTVTFTGAGAFTIVCTVNGATAPPPTNGIYTISGTAVAGTPREVEAGQAAQPEPAAQDVQPAQTSQPVQVEEYDPYDHTVAEVMAEARSAGNDPEYIQALITAEESGKNRSTLISQLQELLNTLR